MAKNPKKPGFKRFFLGLAIYAVIFLGLAFWGLTEFWSFIEAYELSRPKNTIAPYVQQLTKEQISGSDKNIFSQVDLNIQDEEACRQFIADSLTQDITYAQNISASTDTQLIYMLLHDGKPIGKVTLGMESADKYGFTPWKVVDESFDFSYLLGTGATVTVPHGFTVLANGVALDSSYITQDKLPYPALQEYYKNYQPPYMVTYTVGSVLGDTVLTVLDKDGKEVTVDENTDLNVYMENCTQAQQDKAHTLLKNFLHSYVAFTSNEGGKENIGHNYYALLKYLVPNGDMAKRMYQALDGLSWARNTGSSITDIQIHHTVDLGGGYYLCDVTYTVEAKLYRDDPITVNNAKVILNDTGSGLYVESLTVY